MKKDIIPKKNVSNPGSAIGEAIGKLIESQVSKAVRILAEEEFDLLVDTGGHRPEKRPGKKLKLVDRFDNDYEIDSLIEDKQHRPLVLIETKWLRYKKHNRDKGSWICTAHYSLRKTYPTIKKTMAILGGSWSRTSVELIRSFGVEVHLVPYEKIVEVLSKYGVNFHWEEKDRRAATLAWNNFLKLSDKQLNAIAKKFTNEIIPVILDSLRKTLTEKKEIKTIEEIEVTIKSSLGELFNKEFKTVEDAIQYLKKFKFD